ncbi:MAG: hypothetical protein Q7V17_13730 [Afipia sp.]|nr:hypothetical protein [Afipia sp.]
MLRDSDLIVDGVPFRLKLFDATGEGRRVNSELDDCIERAIKLALHFALTALELHEAVDARPREPLTLRVVGLCELGERDGMHQVFAQAVECNALDL